MKAKNTNHDLRTYNLISTLLTIVNTNDSDDSDVFLAQAMLDNIDKLDHISIYDLAEDCFVSRSSLQRFFKRIGFDSYAKLKAKIPEALVHNRRFVNACQANQYTQSYHSQMEEMMNSIEELVNSVHMDYFLDLIHNAKRVVFCYAAYSSLAPVAFQEAMISNGKLIRCVTNSSRSIELLNELEEFDLLVTLSMTGNYALATLHDVQDVKAMKVLFTLNHLDKFKEVYDRVIYLSNNDDAADYIQDGVHNAYTTHGFSYLFDLLFDKYIQRHGTIKTMDMKNSK